MVDLTYFLVLSAALFGVGCFGLLARPSTIAVLMSAELMLNAGILALVAFARFGAGAAHHTAGPALALFVALVAAADLAVGSAIVLVIYRAGRSLTIDEPMTG